MHGSTHTLGWTIVRAGGERPRRSTAVAEVASRTPPPQSARSALGHDAAVSVGRLRRRVNAALEHALFAATLAALACLESSALALLAIAR